MAFGGAQQPAAGGGKGGGMAGAPNPGAALTNWYANQGSIGGGFQTPTDSRGPSPAELAGVEFSRNDAARVYAPQSATRGTSTSNSFSPTGAPTTGATGTFSNAPAAAGGGKGGGTPGTPTPDGGTSWAAPNAGETGQAAQPNNGGGNSFNVMNASANWLQQAGQGTRNAMNYDPRMVNPAGPRLDNVRATLNDGRNFDPGTVAGSNISQYQNPYTRQVIDRTTADMNRAREMTQNDIGAQATAAGAFGGSRHGLVEAENNRNFANAVGDMAAGQRQNSFMNAQNMAQQDVANLAMGQNMRNAAAGQLGGFNMQNANRLDAMNQFNANQLNNANQSQMMGANQLANLSSTAFDRANQINSGLANSGAMQQGLQQQIINAANGQWNAFTGQPNAALGTVTNSLSASPGNTSGQQSSSYQPGLMDFLPLLAFL